MLDTDDVIPIDCYQQVPYLHIQFWENKYGRRKYRLSVVKH